MAARVFQAANVGLRLVKSADYGRLHERTGTFVVYGKLNIKNFSPYMARGDKWALAECKDNTFYGLTPINGEENHDYHVVIVRNGRLHCMNLVDNTNQWRHWPSTIGATAQCHLLTVQYPGCRCHGQESAGKI